MKKFLLWWMLPFFILQCLQLIECNFNCVWYDNEVPEEMGLEGSVIWTASIAVILTFFLNLVRWLILLFKYFSKNARHG